MLKRGLHRLIYVCICQNATLLETTCLALTLHVAPMPPTRRRLLTIAAMVAILDIATNGF